MRELNEGMVKFCEEYVANGFNGTQAYKSAYGSETNVPSDNVAAVEAHRLLRDSRIIEKIKDVEGDYRIAGHKAGVNKQAIMNALSRMLTAQKAVFYNGLQIATVDDFIAINNAVTTYAKLTGDFAVEKKEFKVTDESNSVDVTKMTDKEKEEYKTKILAEL